MACVRDWLLTISRQVALRQDRVAGIRPRTVPTASGCAARPANAAARAALGAAQVIPACPLIYVRAFDPDRVLARIDAAVDQHLARTLQLQRGAVELLDPDRAVAAVARRAFRRAVVQHVRTSVVVDEHRRIDAALQLRQPRRIGPRARRILRSHDVVAAAVHVRVEDVERAVAILDARREHAARHAELAEVELRRPIDDAADLPPVTRSRLSNTGMPGKYANVEWTR